MTAGDTFHYKAMQSPCEHLYVICSDPYKGNVVLVNFTKFRGMGYYHDEACVIDRGEFRSLPIKSWVSYQHAKAVPWTELEKAFRHNLVRRDHAVSAVLLKRIQQGALASKNTSLECRRILESQGVTEPDEDDDRRA